MRFRAHCGYIAIAIVLKGAGLGQVPENGDVLLAGMGAHHMVAASFSFDA